MGVRARGGAARRLAVDLLDLVLPLTCVGCGVPSTAWCAHCAEALAGPAFRAVPSPCPPGLPATWAVSAYDGAVREAVVAHKERSARGVAAALCAALAVSVEAAIRTERGARVLLVPAPSRPAAVRTRGDDPTHRLAIGAAALLRASGHEVVVARLLRMSGRTRDQSGLDSVARAANLASAVRVVRGVGGPLGSGFIVLVDDIVTTGATLAECARALDVAGLSVTGAAVVAATRRRSGVGSAQACHPG